MWFPTTGTLEAAGDNTYFDAGWDAGDNPLVLQDTAGSPTQLTVKPLTFDYTQEPDTASQAGQNFSLRDLVEGQDWLCQRIVGKFHGHVYDGGNNPPINEWLYVRVALGIFVARSKDAAEAEPDLEPAEFDPFAGDNIQDSWMFRRTWILQNDKSKAITGDIYPTSTVGYHSVLDGPHLDIKSKRRIDREHRLWAVVAARGYSPGFIDPTSTIQLFSWFLDYRIHGTMKPGRNRPASL